MPLEELSDLQLLGIGTVFLAGAVVAKPFFNKAAAIDNSIGTSPGVDARSYSPFYGNISTIMFGVCSVASYASMFTN